MFKTLWSISAYRYTVILNVLLVIFMIAWMINLGFWMGLAVTLAFQVIAKLVYKTSRGQRELLRFGEEIARAFPLPDASLACGMCEGAGQLRRGGVFEPCPVCKHMDAQ